MFSGNFTPSSRILPSQTNKNDADYQLRLDAGELVDNRYLNIVLQVNSQAKHTGLREWVKKQAQGTHAKMATARFDKVAKDQEAEADTVMNEPQETARNSLYSNHKLHVAPWLSLGLLYSYITMHINQAPPSQRPTRKPRVNKSRKSQNQALPFNRKNHIAADMSTVSFTLSQDYGYVILAAASTFVLNTIHGFNTGKFRKAACIAYPAAYASNEVAKDNDDAYRFNCAQRAHANYTENHTSVLATLLIAGVGFPRVAAGLGATWVVGRYLYMTGYSNLAHGRGGKGRYRGMVSYIGQLGLLGLTVYSGLALVMGW
ncbi:hypothetical protein V496_08205 [Pseudogymnoascus sp. VKM F-4515 (FW-2607)]|nr:hypothetical protein V496_08205 [Pseudogymnoascus sp. VKM F-4515 (FW-2607)]